MRAVVNLATGPFVKGQQRLNDALHRSRITFFYNRGSLPPGCPAHSAVPYAFKAFAIKAAADTGLTTLLWADACILPVKALGPLWERIERDGYWIGNNGWTNYEWTADSAYAPLFGLNAEGWPEHPHGLALSVTHAKELNRQIPHVVATAFGISLAHPIGRAILDEYYRLASTTKAFCGPWQNANYLGDGWPYAENPPRLMPCGPSDVRGHRHDQTALSVIAWRLGCKLTNSPEVFAYKGGETDETILVADGAY